MLKAYSVFKNLDKKACELLTNAGIKLELSNSEERPNKEELLKLLHDYDILIIGVREKLTKDMLTGINNKKIIATLSIGLDHIDKSFFESDLIKIINCQTSNVISVAEHIFSLILSLKKRIVEANEIAMNGGTKQDLFIRSNDISNSTIGIIGAGKISREVIKIAKVFNMKIYCNTLSPEKHKDLLKQGVEFLSLDELLSNSDIITVNIPLNEENKNLISKDKIRLMKNTATFINTSRAEIVDMNELIRYADESATFNVGLDIDAENYKEILNIKRNNVIVTPHIAGVTKEAIKRMDVELANNIREYIQTRKQEISEKELWEILDDNGNATGEIVEKYDKRAFEKGCYHLGADVWIINSDNNILIQKRAKQKKLQPNVWAMTGGSVILGENPIDTIVREAKEELDIDINANNLKLITKFKTENVWIDTYVLKCDYDISKMKFQEDEVSDVKWATWTEINNLVNNGQFIKHRWEFVSKFIKKEMEM